MFRSRLSREGEFFDLFNGISDLILEASNEFREMLLNPDRVELHARSIKELEHKADHITHNTIELLHRTFITPFDRDDIHKLISRMDDILDFIDAAAQRVFYYEVGAVTEEAKQLADICVDAAGLIKSAVRALSNLKNPDGLYKLCIEINRLENDGDHVLRVGVARLFKEEQDVRRLIKLKEIYELLETVTDRCEDVANIIEGIALEYA